MYFEENQTRRIFGSDNTMGLFVALYLILLAFFIILASVSTQAMSRVSTVLDSVSDTFAKKVSDGRSNVQTEEGREDAVLLSVQQSFALALDIKGRFPAGHGRLFEVQFPEDYLFEKGSFRVRADMEPLLDQITALLRERRGEYRLEVAFMFGTGDNAVSRTMTRGQEVAIRRAGSLARFLRTEGVNAGTFSTGFVAIPEGQILAVFRSAIDRDEVLDLSDASPAAALASVSQTGGDGR